MPSRVCVVRASRSLYAGLNVFRFSDKYDCRTCVRSVTIAVDSEMPIDPAMLRSITYSELASEFNARGMVE